MSQSDATLKHDDGSLHEPAPQAGLASLSPAYFGMVMATGIVSLAAWMRGWPRLAEFLFALNLAVYVLLWVLYLLRLFRHPRRFLGDLFDHLLGPAFFTVVAATGVLGSQFLLLDSALRASWMLWTLAIALWLVLTYTIFTVLTVKENKPTLDRGISGGWLLAVVATQSLTVLSALLAARTGQPWKLELNYFALSMWLWGGMLYIWMMSLIFYRYTFFRFQPHDLSPPYWINMGAMAISTLAGSLLILNADEAPFLTSVLPFIKGFTVFYWATGTWWIPMLLVLGVWRHVYKRFPLRYDPLYWGAVFPLGMYAACTHQLALAMKLDFLDPIPDLFFAAAIAAWTATFLGALRRGAQSLLALRAAG
ncbi:tellurite resistance/C4-dicarboxylate transporter family protein [Thermomonas sp.]|uniref:tellurite resistance/C4-dicarboxylate transporter family protein n=1 Tax=Thermomonas sp. TaxID=1971895 RepID=UPI002B5F78F1|nr:tellurite resistance/C4-dicarboxylate transporter family protein [Thermomonas sp.]HRO62546.1 tellurite resistance/C4-dicarboxylate transporter family protein [Thermomonas sp.]